MKLHDGKLEIHLVVLEYLKGVELIKNFESLLNVASYLSAFLVSYFHIDLRPIEYSPELNYVIAQRLYAFIELPVKFIHLYEIFTIKVTILLILRGVHVNFVYFVDLPE